LESANRAAVRSIDPGIRASDALGVSFKRNSSNLSSGTNPKVLVCIFLGWTVLCAAVDFNSGEELPMTCPTCGSLEIRESRSAQWSDFFYRLGDRSAFRCRRCRNRFFAPGDAESTPVLAPSPRRAGHGRGILNSRSKKRFMSRLLVISIFGAAFLVFWFFLRYLTTERPPSSNSTRNPLVSLAQTA
jgi:hypothetical protein